MEVGVVNVFLKGMFGMVCICETKVKSNAVEECNERKCVRWVRMNTQKKGDGKSNLLMSN